MQVRPLAGFCSMISGNALRGVIKLALKGEKGKQR